VPAPPSSPAISACPPPPCAPRWSARLGETSFQILYGLVALLALGTLIAAYGQASHQVYL